MIRRSDELNMGLSNQAKFRLAVKMALFNALVTPCTLYALPDGADSQFGQSALQVKGNDLTINQTSQQAIINWRSFGIAANESVRVLQPVQGSALYRVVGSGASQILGRLSATGSLFLINPNGILFGSGAQVDVGSLVATSMNMSNANFLSKNYQLNATGGTGSVVNQGAIKVADGGYLVLLGNEVKNSGTLIANNGSVVMGSAESAVLDFYGNGLVKARLSGDALSALVEQAGTIQAAGGFVQLATNSRSSAVNVTGVVQADSLIERNGVIRLEGGSHARVSVDGTLSAAGKNADTKGGSITVSGEQLALLKQARLDASGNAGGGEVLVGGDYQGKNTQVQNARTTYVDKDATIAVDAKLEGNGGKAIVWADDVTRYYGSISAQGGATQGNGGFVEVSGKQSLDFFGAVDVAAPNGIGGLVLLDPKDIILNTTTQATPPNNANGTPDVAFADAPAAGTTTIQIADITGFSELFLQATNDITVASILTMAANNSIRLQANNNIAINAAVTVSGSGNINFKADADSSGVGNVAIAANITAQAGGIDLSGATISRSAGNIATSGGANANAGNINITATGAVNLSTATLTASGGTASAGTAGKNGGTISISGSTVTTTGTKTASGSNGNGANQIGGNAGNVTISSTTGMSVGAITNSGGNAGTGIASGGNAGSITLTNSTSGNILAGALTARTGNAIGTGAGGTVGAINITNNAAGTLTTGALSTAGGSNGNGGVINLTTTSGNLTTTSIASSGGTALTGTAGRNAAAITINSGGSVSTTTIAASGSAGVGTSQNGGNAANINITGNTGITTSTVTASGGNATATNGNGGNAGNINITNNTSGNIVTTTLAANTGSAAGTGTGGTAAAIVVNNAGTAGNLTTGAISTLGGSKGAGGNVTLTSAGNLTAGTLTTSGGATVTGNAGLNAGAITVNSSGNVTVGAIVAAGSAGVGTNQSGGSGGTVSLNAGAASNTITMTSVTTTGGNRTGTGVAGAGGSLTVTDAALLSANTTIDTTGGSAGSASGGAVGFANTVNSSGANRSLTINSNAATTFGGAVGNTLALTSLTTNAGGSTAINGGAVTTVGAQAYGDSVTLGAPTTLTTSNANVTFSSSINANGNALNISAGSGAVSAINAANNFSQLAITAGSANIRDVNAIVLGATNVTGAYGLQTAGAITQSAAVTVGGATTLAAGVTNDITLNNAGNNFNSVVISNGRDVSLVDANALTIGTSSVKTINAKTLSNNLTLAGNITATGSGTSILLASAQNFLNPGNSSLNPGTGRWLVYSTTPTSDTRGAGLLAGYNFKQYNATLTDTVLGTGNGFIYSTPAVITASLGGSASKVYDGTTAASIASLTLGKSGMIDGDTVNISALGSATYSNKNAGSGKTVSSNTLAITSASNGAKQVYGYELANAGVATGAVGTVSQRDITAVTGITANNKTYDGNTSATLNVGSANFTGIVSGETLTVGAASGTFNSKDVISANTVNISGIALADGTGLAGNYNLTNSTASASASITARPVTVTANAGQIKTAGAADPLPFTYSLSGLPLVGGDLLSGALSRLTGEATGNYAINQGTLDAGSNYNISYVSNPFTIIAAKPSDDAGLGSVQVATNGRSTSNVAVLNVGETAAGNTTESGSEDSAAECKSSVNPSTNNPGASVMFNFGIKLPAGVKPACI